MDLNHGDKFIDLNFPEDIYEYIYCKIDWIVCKDREGVQLELELSEIDIKKVDDIPYIKNKPKKHNDGKPIMSLVRPEFITGVAEGLTYGYTKYEEERGDIQNFLKGDGHHYSTVYDSLQRHLNSFWSGEEIDPESGLHHLKLASANLMFLLTYEESDKGIDDRTILEKNNEV